MPTTTDSVGSLQISSLDIPTLNDRFRRISSALGTSDSSSTGSGSTSISQVTLIVRDTLGVESGAAPLITLPTAKSFSEMVMILGTLPIGGGVTIQLFANGTAWGPSLTGTGQVTKVSVASYPAIAKDMLIRLDITGVPALLSGVSFPGADLTVELR